MASFTRRIASGLTDTLDLDFPYIDKQHVKVSLDGVLLSSAAYTWPSASQVKFNAGNPAAGTVLLAERDTPSDPMVSFTAGGVDPVDLNLANKQALMVGEEAKDKSAEAFDGIETVLEVADALTEAVGRAEAARDQAEALVDGAEAVINSKLTNDGTQIAVVDGLNVSPVSSSDTVFHRGNVNLPNGGSIQSRSDDFSTMKGLELIGSQIQLLSGDGPVLVKGSAGTDLSPQTLHVITQPQATGTAEGSYLMNRFEAEFHREQLGDGSIEGDEGSGIVNLLHCYLGVGGPNFKADSAAAAAFGTVINQADTSIGDRLGFNSGVLAMFSTTARLYGGSTGVTIAEGATAAQMIGFEADMFLFGATDYKFGFHSWAGGKHQATVVDAAYGVGIRGGTIDGDPVAKWRSVIALFTGTSGNRPVDENTDFLMADQTTSLKNVLNLENITVASHIIKAQHTQLTGDGQLTLGDNVETGSVALNTPAGSSAFYSVQQGGAAKWTWGVDNLGKWFIYNVVGTKTVLTIDPATSSVLIDDDLGVSGLINGTVVNETQWASYTPTISAQSGTITTVGAVAGKYKRLPGRTIVAQVRATVTTAGSAGGGLVFTLPVVAATDIPAVVNGRESALNGRALCGLTNGTTGFVTYADATTPFADGVQVTVEVTYEAAAAL